MSAKIWGNIFSGFIGIGLGLLSCGLYAHNDALNFGAGVTVFIAFIIRAVIANDSKE